MLWRPPGRDPLARPPGGRGAPLRQRFGGGAADPALPHQHPVGIAAAPPRPAQQRRRRAAGGHRHPGHPARRPRLPHRRLRGRLRARPPLRAEPGLRGLRRRDRARSAGRRRRWRPSGRGATWWTGRSPGSAARTTRALLPLGPPLRRPRPLHAAAGLGGPPPRPALRRRDLGGRRAGGAHPGGARRRGLDRQDGGGRGRRPRRGPGRARRADPRPAALRAHPARAPAAERALGGSSRGWWTRR